MFRRPKERFVFLCIAGLVALTGLTRITSDLYANRPLHVHHRTAAMYRTEEDLEQMRNALSSLESDDPVTRAHGAAQLGLLGPKATCATATLSAALKDPDQSVRVVAAQALGSIGRHASPAVPQLVDALKDNDSEVRFRVIESLGKIGPAARPALTALTTAQTIGTSEEQSAAMLALNRIQYPQLYSPAAPPAYATISRARIAPPNAQPMPHRLASPAPTRLEH